MNNAIYLIQEHRFFFGRPFNPFCDRSGRRNLFEVQGIAFTQTTKRSAGLNLEAISGGDSRVRLSASSIAFTMFLSSPQEK
jgi:hypothetical protein